ncbi:hypothetical protein BT63DRAFT_462184 [Microthyrium microscopicum]|uniref:Uncharacterized protein n=1 Tax=Microthyrium microscopicum TaxID=703497 RepID=A0A6A6USA3_9PEZI|nr:hypothetical protein BT63DRAFT_462184 [Microthyrium microscopicum]
MNSHTPGKISNKRQKRSRKGLTKPHRLPLSDAMDEIKRLEQLLEQKMEKYFKRRERWQARWDPATGRPTEEQMKDSTEERLRAEFFKHKDAKPRCYSCRINHAVMPSGSEAPNGTEDTELLPCGCSYNGAMLQMFLAKSGLFVKGEGPDSLGVQRVLYVKMFEVFFGKFTFDKLVNGAGARLEAAKKQAY